MKTIISLITAGAVLASAGAAFAVDPAVNVSGNAPGVCTLPDTWTFVTGLNGGASGQFSGHTWTIPESALVSNGDTIEGQESAIRIRGNGFCNVSHTIQLQSSNGGLKADTPAPAGFTDARPMSYEAQWSTAPVGSTSRGPFGPQATLDPTAPGQMSAPAVYNVGPSLAPPGARAFDIRMGMQRPLGSLPLIAGHYTDTVTVTLSPTS
jgi:hypothetical protein